MLIEAEKRIEAGEIHTPKLVEARAGQLAKLLMLKAAEYNLKEDKRGDLVSGDWMENRKSLRVLTPSSVPQVFDEAWIAKVISWGSLLVHHNGNYGENSWGRLEEIEPATIVRWDENEIAINPISKVGINEPLANHKRLVSKIEVENAVVNGICELMKEIIGRRNHQIKKTLSLANSLLY